MRSILEVCISRTLVICFINSVVEVILFSICLISFLLTKDSLVVVFICLKTNTQPNASDKKQWR